MKMQPGLLMHRAVEQLEFGVDGQQCGLQLIRLGGCLGTEGGVESLFVGVMTGGVRPCTARQRAACME